MTEARTSGLYNDVLFTIFGHSAKKKLVTEESIAVKVFKYFMSFDYNCRKFKTYLKLQYLFHEVLKHSNL